MVFIERNPGRGTAEKKSHFVRAIAVVLMLVGTLWISHAKIALLLIKESAAPSPPPPLRPPARSAPTSIISDILHDQDCTANPETNDPFPVDFDHEYYNTENRNSVSPSTVLDEMHYNAFGKVRGWNCTKGQHIREHINKIAEKMSFPSLEIGPFLNPTMVGEKVKYFDVLDREGLIERAGKINYPIVREVEIDFVVPSGDLNAINESSQFSMILSSHCIEHQLDLVRHLHHVSRLLVDGGYYVLLIPDKRYCFDHYIAPTTIADVLDDYQDQRYFAKSHRLKSVIEHRAMTFHGNFWASPLPPKHENIVERVKSAVEEFENHRVTDSYLDVHNYQFTPDSIGEIVFALNEMNMIKLSVHRVYQTIFNTVEFGLVLKNSKC